MKRLPRSKHARFLAAVVSSLLLSPSLLLASSATDPVGPAGWSVKNWVGFALQISLFLGALWALSLLAASAGPAGRTKEGDGHDG